MSPRAKAATLAAAVALTVPAVAAADVRLPADTPPAYVAECGACHDPFAPQLMRRSDWKQVVAGLDRHFGVNAALTDAEVRPIAAFLERNGADDADADRAATGMRISATPNFRRHHGSIPRTAWTRPDVMRASNCGACHFTSDNGAFGHDVSVPGGH